MEAKKQNIIRQKMSEFDENGEEIDAGRQEGSKS